MNEFSIKTSTLTDTSSNQGTRSDKADNLSALAALATNFQELVHKVGTNVDTGLSSITERQGISAVSESREPSPRYDDSPNSQRNDEGNHQVARERDESRADSRDDTPRNRNNADNRRDPEAISRDERGDTREFENGASQDETDTKSSTQTERPQGDDRRDENRADSGDNSDTDAANSETAENSHNNGKNDSNTASKNGRQNSDLASAVAQNAAPLNGLDAAQLITQSSSQLLKEGGVISGAEKMSSTSGLAIATASSAKAAGVHSATMGQTQAAKNNGKIQANLGSQNQGQTETATKNQSTMQQQAQQMARTLSENTRMQINVNVANEAETLTSRPTNTLAAGVSLAADSRGLAQAGQQQNTHAATPSQTQIGTASAGQPQGSQTQGQNAQTNLQNSQTQSLTQLSGEGKGLNASSSTSHAGTASASTAGGENTSNSTSLSGSGQTQQTQATQQSAQVQRNTLAQGPQNGPTATEQVSVRITRALQAGGDRISIRLNPADLGRVEVRMELAQNGQMTAVVTADNRETLDLLKRDASELQKALEAGGLDLDSNNLAFNLRGEDGQTADGGDGSTGTQNLEEEASQETVEIPTELSLNPEDLILGEGRVDVRA